MEKQFTAIKTEHVLFWNLWCLNYCFEKIAPDYVHYSKLSSCCQLLWSINDNGAAIDVEEFSFIQHFDENVFEALDDFNIEELAVKEFVNAIDPD